MLSVEAIDLYYGASHALRRVSLTAEKGEVTCILGRNGVGKTSLLRAIFGLHPIRSGHIRWEDRILNSLSPHEQLLSGYFIWIQQDSCSVLNPLPIPLPMVWPTCPIVSKSLKHGRFWTLNYDFHSPKRGSSLPAGR